MSDNMNHDNVQSKIDNLRISQIKAQFPKIIN